MGRKVVAPTLAQGTTARNNNNTRTTTTTTAAHIAPRLAFAALAALAALCVVSATTPVIPGGFKEIDTGLPEVASAFTFVKSSFTGLGADGTHGMDGREDCSDASKTRHTMVVYQDLQGKYTLASPQYK